MFRDFTKCSDNRNNKKNYGVRSADEVIHIRSSLVPNIQSGYSWIFQIFFIHGCSSFLGHCFWNVSHLAECLFRCLSNKKMRKLKT